MDGCSSGIDSYFAATLFGKILSKIFTTLQYPQAIGFDTDIATTSKIIEFVCHLFYKDLVQAKCNLFLERNELLSTLIIAVYKPVSKELSIMAAGDGVYTVNGDTTVIDEDNKPNYIAYHFDKEFETWFNEQTTLRHYSEVSSFAISTDGVESFAKEALNEKTEGFDAINYLLVDDSMADSPAMLHKKCLLLESNYQLISRDDVAIIRVINRQ